MTLSIASQESETLSIIRNVQKDRVGNSRIIAPECDCGGIDVLIAASKEPVNGRVVVECRVKFFRIEPVGLIVQL